MSVLDKTLVERAFRLLGQTLELEDVESFHIVVCGGASLIASSLVARTTKDVDVVALLDSSDQLVSPAPLPEALLDAAATVAEDLALPADWLNNGPSRGIGGLFQMGLPQGLASRLQRRDYGSRLSVHFVGRLDQIFFKVYAAVDQGPGRHAADLTSLQPTDSEIAAAARWAMTHDVSDGFRMVLKQMISGLGYSHVADKL